MKYDRSMCQTMKNITPKKAQQLQLLTESPTVNLLWFFLKFFLKVFIHGLRAEIK